ncbi:MAG: hypothetical protein KTU85_00850 [Acidimicrobiia bacterium]|nr:hypothetical protein [Acidimicrobiia bacterium]
MHNTLSGQRITLLQLTREALAISIARRTVTVIVILIAAVGTFIPLVISAQAENARADALTTLNRPEQRIVKIIDNDFLQGSTTLDPPTVMQLRELSIVENLLALGTVQDTRSSRGWPVSTRIPTTDILAVDASQHDPCGSVRLPRNYGGSPHTLHLALEPAYLAVAGKRQTEPHPFADPALATRNICEWTGARQLLVLVDEPASVQRIVDLIPSFADINVTASIPDDLDELRRDLATGLSDSARYLRNLATLGAGVLVAATIFVTAGTQTRHMARRRALGATRFDVAILILGQVAMSVMLGALIATLVFSVTATNLQYLIDASLALAVVVSIILTSLVASLPVAVVAATRDPAEILRVP